MKKLIVLSLILALAVPVIAESGKSAQQNYQRVRNNNYIVADVIAAQKYTDEMLEGEQSWRNYDLTSEEITALGRTGAIPEGKRLKPGVLYKINRVRELAGLPKMTEKQIQIPIREYWNFTWLNDNWKISPKLTGETKSGYRYEESVTIESESSHLGSVKSRVEPATN